MKWTNDQGYQRVPGHINFTKSYLQGGQTTKDTDRYLVTKIFLSPTYKVDELPRIPTGTWSQKFLLSPTYGMEELPRTLTGT